MGQIVEINSTTVTSPRPAGIETASPWMPARLRSNACPHAATAHASARATAIRNLLLRLNFQVDDGLLAGVERAQSSHRTGCSLELRFQGVIHVRIQAVKLVGSLVLRDKRTHLQ